MFEFYVGGHMVLSALDAGGKDDLRATIDSILNSGDHGGWCTINTPTGIVEFLVSPHIPMTFLSAN